MVLIDTNVLAYLLIEGDRTGDALALWAHDSAWLSEPFLWVEFSNILVTYQRSKALSLAQVQGLLGDAQQRVTLTPEVAHADVLVMAATYGVSAYDARFLVAAQNLGLPLITEDERLRRAAPRLTLSMKAAVRE